MSVQPQPRMTVDEFLALAEDQSGRYELVDGEVFAMSPERVGHARTKYRVQSALQRAIARSGLACEMLPDGITVRVDDGTAYEPDALVQCGDPMSDETVEATAPTIVVEVVSPSGQAIDTNRKLGGDFRVPSVMQYLIIEPKRPMVIRHRRGTGDTIETRVVSSGSIDLSPPGLSLDVADFFERARP
jgi:Uma2 family endonuclease